MTGTSLNAVLFLIGIVFDFYIMAVFFRLLLAWVHADYYSPITQFVIKVTDVFVKPMKKVLPDVRGFETATLVLMLLVEMIKYFLITIFSFGLPNIVGLFVLSIGDTLNLILQTLCLALILQALLSWIMPGSPIYLSLYKLTAPIIRPIQRIIPPIAGIDISPLPVIIILQLLIIIVATPIKGFGLALAIGS